VKNPRLNKRQREQDRQQRAERKRQRRVDREAMEPVAVVTPAASQDQILERLAVLHDKFAAGSIELDEFEAARDDLTSQLRVD
jgi:hypothetical protein